MLSKIHILKYWLNTATWSDAHYTRPTRMALIVPTNAKPLRAAPRRKTRVKKNQDGISLRQRTGMTLYRSPRTIMPSEFDTTLLYTVQEVVTNNGALLASIQFSSNAYDVDSALASTAMAGFAEFAAFYARFRTIAMQYDFVYANQEAFPVSVLAGFTNLSVSSSGLGLNYSENPLFKTDMIGPLTGEGQGRMSSAMVPLTRIAGTVQPLYDDLWTGATTSNTLSSSGTCYIKFGVVSAQNLTAAGVLVAARIKLHLRFYRPWLLTS